MAPTKDPCEDVAQDSHFPCSSLLQVSVQPFLAHSTSIPNLAQVSILLFDICLRAKGGERERMHVVPMA